MLSLYRKQSGAKMSNKQLFTALKNTRTNSSCFTLTDHALFVMIVATIAIVSNFCSCFCSIAVSGRYNFTDDFILILIAQSGIQNF